MRKLPKIKTLENKLWILCKEITRLKYINTCFTCPKEDLFGKELHTGHFLKKRILPYEMKYDLRILRNQCSRCNLRGNGNEGLYAINLVKTEGVEYLLQIDSDVRYYSLVEEMGTAEKREYLLKKIDEYKQIKRRYLDIE